MGLLVSVQHKHFYLGGKVNSIDLIGTETNGIIVSTIFFSFANKHTLSELESAPAHIHLAIVLVSGG